MSLAEALTLAGAIAQLLQPRQADDAGEGMADRFARSGTPGGGT